MKKISFMAIGLLSLSFISCGTQKKSETPVKSTTKQLSQEEFKDQCTNVILGRISIDGQRCLKTFFKDLPQGAVGPYVDIDNDFYPGKYLIATGDFGTNAVSVVLDGQTLLTNAGILDPKFGGKLQYYVNGSGYKNVSVTVLACYGRNIDKVVCLKDDVK